MSAPVSNPALAYVSYFAGLDEGVLAAISAITRLQRYAKGEILFLEGEPCQGIYIVQSGWLKGLIISPGGREQIIRLLGPGESFNEHGIFIKEECNLVTVQAIEDSSVWVIDKKSLMALLDRHPILYRTITQNLASRVVHLMKLVEDLSLRTVEARVARLLLDETANPVERQRWATQAEMASRLGTVVDVINRALHKLEDEGLIRIARHRIEILDRQRLIEKAEICG